MPPLVVPQVCRYAVNQTIGGQDVVNILDMQVDTTGSTTGRSDALFNVAGDILNAWSARILVNQSNQLSALSVSWLDLNTLDGNTGERSGTSANAWPKAGSLTGTGVMPAMVSLRADKATSGGRGTKRGRIYFAGMREDDTAPGVAMSWTSTIVRDWNAGLALFLQNINDQDAAGIPFDIQRQLVVVHAGLGTFSEVTGLSANPLISTQVRRGALR